MWTIAALLMLIASDNIFVKIMSGFAFICLYLAEQYEREENLKFFQDHDASL